MGLFGSSKKERKELKGEIDKLMKAYSNEKIDGDTYFKNGHIFILIKFNLY